MRIFKYLLGFSLLLLAYSAHSQDYAIDFTQNDCEGNSHQLFDEHNAGKVVILEFVMLNCAPCIVGTNALESILAPYEISYPGRVQIYSFGFLNSYTCEQLMAWRSDNEFNHPVFNNGEDQVDYYGGMGMPTIVVTGTNTHKVFYKSIGYLPSMDKDIKAAIDSALQYSPSGVGEMTGTGVFRAYPTVFTDQFTVETDVTRAGAEVILSDSYGRILMKSAIPGSGKLDISTSGLSRGMYIVRLNSKEGLTSGTLMIRQ